MAMKMVGLMNPRAPDTKTKKVSIYSPKKQPKRPKLRGYPYYHVIVYFFVLKNVGA